MARALPRGEEFLAPPLFLVLVSTTTTTVLRPAGGRDPGLEDPASAAGPGSAGGAGGGEQHSLAATGATGPAVLTTDYAYDRLYRLTGADDGSPRSYGYDPAGNRSLKDTTGYSYDRADRITSAGGVSYTVDANGNLVSRGADSFGYDQANRLRTASVGGTSSGFV